MTGEKEAPAEMPGGRSIWEVANQLGGYIGPNTPDDLVAFLSRESEAAAALAQRIVDLEGEVADYKSVIEREDRLVALAKSGAANITVVAPNDVEKEQEIEHFAALAFDDLGKNPPVAWRDRALAAEAALAAERERCAKIADDNADNDSRGDSPYDNGAGSCGYRKACYDIAAAIRAQANNEPGA